MLLYKIPAVLIFNQPTAGKNIIINNNNSNNNKLKKQEVPIKNCTEEENYLLQVGNTSHRAIA